MGIIYFSNGLIFLSIPRNIATSSFSGSALPKKRRSLRIKSALGRRLSGFFVLNIEIDHLKKKTYISTGTNANNATLPAKGIINSNKSEQTPLG
jgi:hypothetical protein